MGMTPEDVPTGQCLCEMNKERFDYVRRGENGEYIIPRDKVDRFVRTYLELSDSDEHLERLKLYRASGPRTTTQDD